MVDTRHQATQAPASHWDLVLNILSWALIRETTDNTDRDSNRRQTEPGEDESQDLRTIT